MPIIEKNEIEAVFRQHAEFSHDPELSRLLLQIADDAQKNNESARRQALLSKSLEQDVVEESVNDTESLEGTEVTETEEVATTDSSNSDGGQAIDSEYDEIKKSIASITETLAYLTKSFSEVVQTVEKQLQTTESLNAVVTAQRNQIAELQKDAGLIIEQGDDLDQLEKSGVTQSDLDDDAISDDDPLYKAGIQKSADNSYFIPVMDGRK